MGLAKRRTQWGLACAAVILGTALLSMIAFLLTEARCGAVGVGQPASTSSYCRALGAPGVSPHSLGVVLLLALFVAPGVGTLAAVARFGGRDEHALRRSALAALSVVGLSFVLMLLAHATYVAD